MNDTNVAGEAAIQTRAGDGWLIRRLRSDNTLYFLIRSFTESCELAAIVDEGPLHDAELPEETLRMLSEGHKFNTMQGALWACANECQNSLTALQNAHSAVKGLFTGKLRDETEEALVRAITGAQARLDKITTIADTWQYPACPFEFRRMEATKLLLRCNEVADNFETMLAEAEERQASSDVIDQLDEIAGVCRKLARQLVRMRERSSQKCQELLRSCLQEVKALNNLQTRIELVTAQRAGTIMFYPNLLRLAATGAATIEA